MFPQAATPRSSRSHCQVAGAKPRALAGRSRGTSMKYIDHPSFDDPSAEDEILAPSTESIGDRSAPTFRPDGWLAPLPPSSTADRFPSREQETKLFRKMNYLKRRANQLTQQLDLERPEQSLLDEIERLRSEAVAIKHRIVEMNLGLVLAIAKTQIRAGRDLSECVSDASLALVQAVDGFDFARGFRFCTYATWAIRNVLSDQQRSSVRHRAQSLAPYEDFLAAPELDANEHEIAEEQSRRRALVWRGLGRLDKRLQRILVSRYGIGGAPKLTLAQLGLKLGISKERVRQLERHAGAKLRKFYRVEGVTASLL